MLSLIVVGVALIVTWKDWIRILAAGQPSCSSGRRRGPIRGRVRPPEISGPAGFDRRKAH
jgi:hypothetical protein